MKLKPCPFCGDSNVAVFHNTSSDHMYDWDYDVQCHGCGAAGPSDPQEGDAIAAWNDRATPQPAPAQGELSDAADADKRDAGRYRWLREWREIHDSGIPWPVRLDPKEKIPTMTYCFGNVLDTAIDVARSAQTNGGGNG